MDGAERAGTFPGLTISLRRYEVNFAGQKVVAPGRLVRLTKEAGAVTT